jgi:hypothetical protein
MRSRPEEFNLGTASGTVHARLIAAVESRPCIKWIRCLEVAYLRLRDPFVPPSLILSHRLGTPAQDAAASSTPTI